LATVLCTVATFLVVVAPSATATVFSNPATITVPDATCSPAAPGKATPYPSPITVSGLTGTVTDVNVTLSNITSDYTGDLEVLLVSPGGAQNLVLMSDAGQAPGTGAGGAVSNLTITFDDAAASFLPQNADLAPSNSSITRKPTNYNEGTPDVFPSPAPAPSANTTLAGAFNGLSPNGIWSLYVVDDSCGDGPDTIGGWSLDVTAGSAAATSTVVTSSVNPSTTGQSVTFTAAVTSGGPVTTGTVTFTEGATTLAANVALDGTGHAAFSTSALAEGDHTITATYNGTASFATSNGSVNQRVDNATTNPSTGTFCNTGAITIPSNLATTPAVPYPSHITVSGFTGTVGKVTAQLKNVTHGFSDDIDVLLVGPSPANNLVLVSDAPRDVTAPVNNVTVTFDDAAASFLPAGAAWGAPNSSVTAKPTDYDPGGAVDTFPAPAPAPSSNTTLSSAFGGTAPNGQWSLYVVDDSLGDAGSVAGGWCITLTPRPTVTINQATGQADPTNASPVLFTAVFSQAVTGFTGSDVSFTGSTAPGTLVANVTGGPTTYTVSVSGMTGSGTVVASIPANATDPLNSASTSTDHTVTYDVTAPTVTINQASGQADPTGTSPVNFTAVFSEAVTGFDGTDISFTGSTAPGTLTANVTGGPSTYNVAVSGMTGCGTVVASIPANKAVDAANNGNTASTSTDHTVTFTCAPDLAVTKSGSPDPVVVAGSNITYTVDVSNSVAGSTAQSVVLSDPIPAHTTFVSLGSPGGWSCSPLPAVGSSGGTVTCTRPTLTSGDGSQSFTLVVRVDLQAPAATQIQNTATVSSTPADSGPGSNTASATTNVTFVPSAPAVVRQSTTWLLRNTLTTGTPDTTFTYGVRPLSPMMGDWDGDGVKTVGTFEGGVFKLNNANDSSAPDITFTFGDPRGFPVAGDFNGDGVDDVAVYRAGLWQIHLSTGATSSFLFGSGTWPATVPVAGDWDGDGVDGIGTYTLMAPGNLGEWNLRQTASAGATDLTFVFGGSGQYPVVGDWNGDGIDGIGVKSMSGPTWSLRNSASAGAPDLTFDYGLSNDLPLTWRGQVIK
jgi:uncharacterized repeat protein (TIGR01451 family)